MVATNAFLCLTDQSKGSNLSEGYRLFNKKLRASFAVEPYKGDYSIGDKLQPGSLLIIPNPQEKFLAKEFSNINAFLERGGNLLVLGNCGKHKSNVNYLLEEYGISMVDGL
eukprot:Partr_v1_DN28162_c0_g1_i3_m56081 putative Intraflagellar transport 52 homolog (Chlamydomonas)